MMAQSAVHFIARRHVVVIWAESQCVCVTLLSLIRHGLEVVPAYAKAEYPEQVHQWFPPRRPRTVGS
jgi:hypothetical protein